MNLEKSNSHHRGHHANRPDLAGEHKAGDAGQLVFLLVFLTVWILDSFILKYTTFLAESISWYFMVIPGVIFLFIAGYLAMSGLRIVFGEVREKPVVIKEGVFSVVRHPIYLGAILVYLGLICMTLSIASIGIWVLIILFYYYISRYEEKILTDLFGPEYREYQKKVPMLFPTKRTFLTVALSGVIAFLSTSETFASETLPVSVNDMNMEKMIDLNSSDIDNLRINSVSSKIEVKPFISNKDNYLMVNFLNADQKDIRFFIEDKSSIYYSGYEGKDLSFAKVFDISRMPTCTYAAKMTVGGKTFYHYFVTD